MERNQRDLSLESAWDQETWARGRPVDLPGVDAFDLALIRALEKLAPPSDLLPDAKSAWAKFAAMSDNGTRIAEQRVVPTMGLPDNAGRRSDAPGSHKQGVPRARQSLFGAVAFLVVLVVALGSMGYLWLLAERDNQLSAPTTVEPRTPASWNTARGSVTRTGISGGQGTIIPLPVAWQTLAGGSTQSGPVIANNVIYQSAGTQVVALSTVDGSTIWTYEAGYNTAAPTLSRNGLYVPVQDGAIHLLDPLTGLETASIPIDPNIYTGLAIAGGDLYVATTGSEIVAFDTTTAKTRWTFAMAPGQGNPEAYAGAVVLADGIVYGTLSDVGIFAIDARDGSLLWSQPIPYFAIETPAYSDRTIFVSAKSVDFPIRGKLFAFDAKTGHPKWSFPANDDNVGMSGVAVANGIVFAGGMDSGVHAFEASTGRELWVAQLKGWVNQPPTIAGDVLYVTSADRKLTALRLVDGTILWSLGLPGAFMEGPVPIGNAIYGATGDGFVVAIGPPISATPSAASP